MRELVFTVNDWKVYATDLGYDIQNYSRGKFIKWKRRNRRYDYTGCPKTIDRFIQKRESALPVEFHRTFGVEIECYHPSNPHIREDIARKLRSAGIQASTESYNHNTRNYWKIITDSSIQGFCGAEVVSPVLQGERGIEELKKVMKVLSELGCRVNRSTGMHVHIGANDLSSVELRRIIDNYRRHEEYFDELVSNSRRGANNNFCKSLRNYPTTEFSGDRYYKVNYCSYIKYGTLEFRQHQGTLNGDKAEHWVRLVESVVNKFSQTDKYYTSLEMMMQDLVDTAQVGWYLERAEELAS